MCRFILYLGPPIALKSLITDPVNSLIHQSYHSIETNERLNGDGFGIAFYVPEVSPNPAVFRSITPAWNNRNLAELARVTVSPCVLAHVRAASAGMLVAEANCHPFTHGRFAFMHNGHIGGFRAVRRRLLETLSDEAFNAIVGTTDSEHVFAMFLDAYRDSTDTDPSDRLAAAIKETVKRLLKLLADARITDHSYLNIAVSDGTSAAIVRFSTDVPRQTDTLYINRGRTFECAGGICRMIDPENHESTAGAVLASSERLSADPSWEKLPENSLVMIRADRRVAFLDLT